MNEEQKKCPECGHPIEEHMTKNGSPSGLSQKVSMCHNINCKKYDKPVDESEIIKTQAFLTVKLVAQLLKVPEESVMRALESGVLKGQQFQGEWFVMEKNLKDYISKRDKST